jgi:redox-sensitive bicupin YhaK (pirin superfamily)
MTLRRVATLRPAVREDVGDLKTRQAIDEGARGSLDPFLLLAHHGPQVYPPANQGLPFGPHPHRGFETVTFIRSGALAHHDTGGHESVIEAGGVQWMTAGSGLIHAELSPPTLRRDGGPLEILQLWVNLPGRLKMTAPRYTGVQARAIPKASLDQGRANLALVSGAFNDKVGPIDSLTGVFMSTVEFQRGSQVVLPAPSGRNVLFYVIAGTVEVDGRSVEAGNLVTFADDGDAIEVATRDRATLLYAHADRIGEPIVSRGPFIMNSASEIEQAFQDYRSGKFKGTPISLDL